MLEVHPFGNFVPQKVNYLLLGSFVTKPANPYDWFYVNGRNQFWPIMEEVHGLPLKTKVQQQNLFIELEMAVADIILSCERKKNSNLDVNLFNLTINTEVAEIIKAKKIKTVFFTSRFVEKLFRQHFKEIAQELGVEQITLPSPSPRYATLTKAQKIFRYKALLPRYPGK